MNGTKIETATRATPKSPLPAGSRSAIPASEAIRRPKNTHKPKWLTTLSAGAGAGAWTVRDGTGTELWVGGTTDKESFTSGSDCLGRELDWLVGE
ncbi:hypothetical protein GCM10027029_17480 [Conyzicola lurida]